MTKVLPDTNLIIYGLTGKEPETTYLKNLTEKRRILISVVTVAEFLVKATSDEAREFEKLLAQFPPLEVTLDIAKVAASYRREFLRSSKDLKLPDCFLAATCQVYGASLATANSKHFPMRDIKIIDRFK